ncbi:MAG: DUF4836 family protein [Acidobacteria bacterium]|nr:DUF4836 family protein [Acidobacteriota bacterium]
MLNTVHHRPGFSQLRKLICLVVQIAAFAVLAFAQSADRDARAALWDSYKMPEGRFVRFLDREKGFSFWHPPDWKESVTDRGNRFFRPAPEGVNLFVLTDDIPDGYGVANYSSAFLQGVRDQPVQHDSLVVRRVFTGGLEWRELSYDLEAPGGGLAHQTVWMTAVGSRVYGFVLSVAQGELEFYEPILKRVVLTAHLGTDGFRRDEFENLRAKISANAQSLAASELIAAQIADDLRTARQSFSATVARVSELFDKSPDAAFDLLIDADPQVRAAAITALGNTRQDALGNEALIWALSDSDALASTAAAIGLSARGTVGLAAFKSKFSVPRALTPAAIVRAGLAFGPQVSRDLIVEMLNDNSANQHLAALQLAIQQERFDSPLPLAKLFNSHQIGVLHATVAVLQQHGKSKALADSSPELVKMLRGDAEVWAARALGEIAPATVTAELEKRIAEIDTRLTAMGKTGVSANNPKNPKNDPQVKTEPNNALADQFSLGTLVDLKTKPEEVRLAVARGQLDLAIRKIKFRECQSAAKDKTVCLALMGEIKQGQNDLSEWTNSVVASNPPRQLPAAGFDAVRLTNAPTTGETLFPQNTISYVMSPNLGATLEKLDAALSGVQMATVRDQMTFALILKMLKTTLADKTGVSQTGDSGTATGIDLASPISLATWPTATGKDAPLNSAVVLRVKDRARFERLLVTYQSEIGDLNTVSTVTAALSRFAGLLPAAVPVVVAAMVSERTRGDLAKGLRNSSSSKPAAPSLKPFTLVGQENLGGIAVTVFDQPTITESGAVKQETIHLVYLGETAIIASSRAAMLDALTTAQNGQSSIAQSEGFAKVRREKGEVVFFSDLPALMESAMDSAFNSAGVKDDEFLKPILKAFGAESGALTITPNSWQTTFNIGLAENEFTASFQPFKADSLSAPRELLPKSTVLYAGAVIDPPKMLGVLKKLEGSGATETSKRSRQIDSDIEKRLVPQMKGEIAAAIVSFQPLFEFNEIPSMVFAAKLKSSALAAELRSGKLFAGFTRVANTSALGSPVVALGENSTAPFVAVSADYFLLADSVATLKSLEAREKFSASRDFARSTQNVPNNLALFATYSLDSAFEEASKMMTDAESQQMLAFLSALVHAFHSQRAFVTLEKDGQKQFLNGHLSVAFDREGRFSVGELAGHSADFDVANALIPAKGLSVIESPRVETLTLRVTAKRPNVAPRVRDDLSKFRFQKIVSSDDSSVVVTTTARRIPENSTVQLPVTDAKFAQYLAATQQINSTAPEIISLAKQIAGDDKNGRSVARKIGEWTHQNLKWKKVQSDVVETLASREADCLEHSELYVALARSLGLPARVVTGAALSGGSFGAHAWVEVYLGNWVEIDPTWGLMDHVDATHLRFDGDAFTGYAMLNQIELEVTEARRAIAEYQRDPVRLVNEFSLDAATRELAFDLSLTVEQALGTDRWNQLDDHRRTAVIKAFERTVAGLWETWNDEEPEPIRILRNEAKGDQRVLTVLRGDDLLRLTLTARNGAWFITEHENLDDAFQDFADAINGALAPESRRGRIYEISLDGAMKHIERIIAAEGEKPELLLLKSRVLASQRNEALLNATSEKAEESNETKKDQTSRPQQQVASDDVPVQQKYIGLLKQIVSRWPSFAPGQLALGRELASAADDTSLSTLNPDTEAGIAALKAYARLVPDDPRVWRELAQAYEQLEKPAEAEAAYRAAIERDNTYLEHHAALVNFLLNHEQLEKAKAAFAQMLKVSTDADEVFESLDDGEGFDADSAKIREALLQAFPSEVAASQSALRLLADLQEAQNKIAEAIKSTQRAIAIEATAEDYESLSRLYRHQRRFTEALAAASQALKLDDSAIYLQFERACSLAQLGRKREALTALKEAIDSDSNQLFDLDEPDLKPLVVMPEFKALREKMKETLKSLNEKPEEQTKPGKP